MKHFLFLIGIVLILEGCNSDKTLISTRKPYSDIITRGATLNTQERWTLNGFKFSEANIMVKTFLNKRGVYDRGARTNIWFSKAQFNSIVTALQKEMQKDISAGKPEITDGVRVYFAKDKNRYSFILVSTRGKVRDTLHRDYFEHESNYFKLESAKGKVDHHRFLLGNRKGAILYTKQCPIEDCKDRGTHYVSCFDGSKWVTNDIPKNSKDTMNTKSEWFELKLLVAIRDELNIKPEDGTPDGVRLYYARKTEAGPIYKDELRHHFVIVTTMTTLKHKTRRDYFHCPNSLVAAYDNGEQCEHNCTGTTAW